MNKKSGQQKDSAPEYPTKQELLAEHRGLGSFLPAGWQKMAAAGGASIVYLVAGLVDRAQAAPPGLPAATTQPAARSTAQSTATQSVRLVPVEAVVAPIFLHGEGRAVTGCIVISPPVFLSEEEAMQVIREELGKYGVDFSRREAEPPIVEVQVATTPKHEYHDADSIMAGGPIRHEIPQKIIGGKMRPDLYDDRNRIAVEFVSEADVDDLNNRWSGSTLRNYEFKVIARKVQVGMRAAKGAYFGVFYEPAVTRGFRDVDKALEGQPQEDDADARWERRNKILAQANKEALRQQVRDFADWLKQHGAIQ